MNTPMLTAAQAAADSSPWWDGIPWFKLEPIHIPLPMPLFGLEAIPIQPFGMLVAFGVLTGMRVAEKYAERQGWRPDIAADFFVHTLSMGFVGAAVLNTVMYFPERIPEAFSTGNPGRLFSGLSSFGGFFFSILGIYLWRHRRRELNPPLWKFADASAFSFPFAWFFGRMGCFVVHDHPGLETDFFLGVENYIVHGGGPLVRRHDLGLYEVIWCFFCALFFLYLAKKKRPDGFYVGLLPIVYAPVRFFLDYLRADAQTGGDIRYGAFTPGQYSSIAFLVIGLIVLRRALEREEREMPEELLIGYEPPSEDSGGGPDTDDASEPAGAGASSGRRPQRTKNKRRKKR